MNSPLDDQSLAELAGLDLEPEAEATTPLLDEAEIQSFAPEASGWASNPTLRLIIAGAAVGSATLALALWLGNVSPKADPLARRSPVETAAQPDETAALQGQVNDLKTELALKEQAQGFAAAKAKPEPQAQPTPAPLPKVPVAAAPPLPSRPAVLPPVPVQSFPVPQPLPAISPPERLPVKPTPPPAERLATLQSLGSYGTGDFPNQQPHSVATSLANAPALSEAAQDVPQSEPLLAGTEAVAVVETPLFWTKALKQTGETTTLVLRQQPGTLPAGTKLLARIEAIDDSGLAQLAATAMIRNGQLQPLPPGAMTIRAEDGAPLMAQRYRGGSTQTASRAVERALLDSLPKSASELLQPKSGDLAGNLLAGVADELLKTARKPASQASQRPTIWHLSEGTTVQVRVNQSVPDPPEVTPAPVENAATVAAIAPPDPIQPAFSSTMQRKPPAAAPTTQPVPATRTVPLWPGYGSNISFLQTGESIVRAWVDNPARVTVDFDQPLCPPTHPVGCAAGQPRIIHLRLVDNLAIPHLPATEGTLLTVVTQTATGERQIYTFRLEVSSGAPKAFTLTLPPTAPTTNPTVLNPMLPPEAPRHESRFPEPVTRHAGSSQSLPAPSRL